jgi:hypothetical protein
MVVPLRFPTFTRPNQQRQGVNVAPTIVTHVAPLGWEHIGLTGDYVWSDGEQPPKMPFDRSGEENQCSQPKRLIHSNPTDRTILTHIPKLGIWGNKAR